MPAGTLQITTPSDREIAMTRVFAAPRDLVFRAYTTPALLKRWLGIHGGWTFAVCEVDLKVGGTYRFVWRNAKGMEMGMSGVYREVVAPERIVQTERFDDPWYEGEAVGTVVLEERAGRTTLTATVRYESRAVRDSVLKSPMESGVAIAYDTLEALLPSLAPRRLGRSVGAVVAGLLAGAGLSIGADAVFHGLGVFPPLGQVMSGALFLLATAYRTVFNVFGCYLAARLAPRRPMEHALALGVLGTLVSLAGALATWNKGPEFGPRWYPLALVILALPSAWLGGALHRGKST